VNDSLAKDDDALESLIGHVADDFLRRQHQGENPDVEEYAARHPEAAPLLREVLASLRLLDVSASGHATLPKPTREGSVPSMLGEFRLLREIGRGGMGIVYEAEQLALKRSVALKILPFAATLDPRRLQRFRNEAQAAAQLDHANIVPVYAVGKECGVHFYVMQLIRGQTLGDLIEQWRAASNTGNLTGSKSADFRTVAQLGVQAADALEYAHQFGIIHRDVKPSNLLLDEDGKLWVTDFGLAHCQSDVSLTGTGDLIGTLRYLSPEQARAGGMPIDHRADVYSLGATLYELLTLRPAVEGLDREEILKKIAVEDPSPLRRHNRAIPRELDSIVRKAMAKAPSERYATAGGLADDLRRFLEDRPILARPPGLSQRVRKWARRHRSLVGMVAILLFAALATIGGFMWWRGQRRAEAAGAARVYLDRAELLQEQEDWEEARDALARAEERLTEDGPADLREKVRRLRDDLAFVMDLEAARFQTAEACEGLTGDFAGADRAYRRAFKKRELEVEHLPAEEVAERIEALAIREPILRALDDWAFVKERLHAGDGTRLLAVAGRIDENPWRQKLRDPNVWRDRNALEQLARESAALEQPAVNLIILCLNLQDQDSRATAEHLLRQLQANRPGDFWINFVLSNSLASVVGQSRGRLEESVSFYRAALSSRPKIASVHLNLGVALALLDRNVEAEQAFRKVLELRGDYAPAYSNLGSVLGKQKRWAEAEEACRKAITLQPDYPEAHNNLGNVLTNAGKLAEGEKSLRRALALRKNYAEARFNLALLLGKQGKPAVAEKEFRAALALKPDNAEIHCNLGLACHQQGKWVEAEQAERRALELRPDYPEAWFNLAGVLVAQGKPRDAEEALRRAILGQADYAAAHFNLGLLLHDRGELTEGEQAFRKVVALQPDHAPAYCNLAWNLKTRERFSEARAVLREGQKRCGRNPAWSSLAESLVWETEQLDRLGARFLWLMSGETKAETTAERLALASFCMTSKRWYAASTRWYAEALALDPTLSPNPANSVRYDAARAAVLAGCGQGLDVEKLDAARRLRLRQQALDWLRADLQAWRQLLEKDAAKSRSVVATKMRSWLQEPTLTYVRARDPLARLLKAEREPWRAFWRDVAQLRYRASIP
jgi:serine/threonine protein kinase/Flp pilus assembly protein TadD